MKRHREHLAAVLAAVVVFLGIDPGDADAELLSGLRCGPCVREIVAQELPLAA